MNKVMVTGLALGLESKACQACNFDFEWLWKYPSVLIWADKILITEGIWSVISNGKIPNTLKEAGRAIKLIFEVAKSEGIVEVKSSSEIMTSTLRDNIFNTVDEDRKLLSKYFPEQISLGDEDKVPGQIFINGAEYCSPYIWAVNADLILARVWDAHCLFDTQVLNYIRYKFGLIGLPEKGEPGSIEAFKTVFESYIPNIQILPEYVVTDKDLCSKCTKEEDCKDIYLSQLEKNLKEIFSFRDYDEIHQIKAVLNDIVKKREELGGILDPEEIFNDFRNQQDKLRKRMKLIFPKVKRWTNITTLLSIPIVVAGVATSLPLITLSGAVLMGMSKASEHLVKLLSSKYSWIGFTSKEIELYQKK